MAAVAHASLSPTIHDPSSTAREARKDPFHSHPRPLVSSVEHANYRQQHSSQSSVGSVTKSPKSGGIFAFAAAAFSSIGEQKIRPRQSLTRLSVRSDPQPSSPEHSVVDRSPRHRSSNPSSKPSSALPSTSDTTRESQSPPLRDPPSRPYSQTDPHGTPPIQIPRVDNKMHQTSSRLLRMTDDDRPFTKVRTLPRPPRTFVGRLPVWTAGNGTNWFGVGPSRRRRSLDLRSVARTSRICSRPSSSAYYRCRPTGSA